jgi:hypothetical protein
MPIHTLAQFEAKENNSKKVKRVDYQKLGYDAFMYNTSLAVDKNYWWKSITHKTYNIDVDSKEHELFDKGFNQAAEEIRKIKCN